jgi:hypothetical protein
MAESSDNFTVYESTTYASTINERIPDLRNHQHSLNESQKLSGTVQKVVFETDFNARSL